MPHLEYFAHEDSVKRISLTAFPFRIGRKMTSDFVIASPEVSKDHAEIFVVDNQVRIRDLGSTNGTFVNGFRISEAPLGDEDVFHLAQEEFRFIAGSPEAEGESGKTLIWKGAAPLSIARAQRHLKELIDQRLVRMLFQPIVDLRSHQAIGFEALARGMHGDLTGRPLELLALADRCGMAALLSRMFCEAGLRDAEFMQPGQLLFLNLHPGDVHDEHLGDHLRQWRDLAPQAKLVLEISEDLSCDLSIIRSLRQRLADLDIAIAYDDFGAGQARFLELAELPPDFVKLDKGLVRGIGDAAPRQNLVRALTRVSVDLGIRVIAEAVETLEEAEVCLDLGCELAQGYYFGLPKAAPHRSPGDTAESLDMSHVHVPAAQKPTKPMRRPRKALAARSRALVGS